MTFYLRTSQLFALCLLVAILPIPLTCALASELNARHQHSPSDLWARSNENKRIYHHDKTDKPKKNHNKKQTAKLKCIHQHNLRHHKKEKVKKISKAACKAKKDGIQKNKKEKTQNSSGTSDYSKTPKAKSNNGKSRSESLIPSSPGFSSLLQVNSACGKARATSAVTVSSGPNGHESFLNCGISGNGWNPPEVTMSMVKSISLDQEPAKTTFSPCLKFRYLFEKYGKSYGIPPIFLAAFAMQESNCRPDAVGDNGGAFGLMQITKDKCGDAPNGNCADPNYNVKMGAKTFDDGLKEANGNVLKALGGYNGWITGLTKSKALQAKDQGCCVCQQNLDYLHQFLNGWILGIDPQSHRLGTIRNLDVCGSE